MEDPTRLAVHNMIALVTRCLNGEEVGDEVYAMSHLATAGALIAGINFITMTVGRLAEEASTDPQQVWAGLALDIEAAMYEAGL